MEDIEDDDAEQAETAMLERFTVRIRREQGIQEACGPICRC
ncbi:hypothetical protein AB0L04_33065 [Streptomyces glaucescens]